MTTPDPQLPPPAPATTPDAATATAPPAPRARLARASLVLGILSAILFPLWPVLSGLAVVLGIAALYRRPRGGGPPPGRWLARCGIAVGLLGAYTSYTVCCKVLEELRVISCSITFKQLESDFNIYTYDHHGAFPDHFEELFSGPGGLPRRYAFCPSATADDDSRYQASLKPGAPFDTDFDYYGAGLQQDDTPDTTIILCERPHAHHNRYIQVMFAPGTGRPYPATSIAEVLAQHPELHLGSEIAAAQAAKRRATLPTALPSPSAPESPPPSSP